MKTRLDEQTIALRVAREFEDGMVINLGYGMPGLCANLIPEDRKVYFHSENGVLGYGALGVDEEKDYELINASDQPVTRMPDMCFFDSALSFDMIRGGHVDLVVLGAYQVSQKGDLANWGRPGRPAASPRTRGAANVSLYRPVPGDGPRRGVYRRPSLCARQ